MSGFWSLCRLRDGSLLPWDLFPLLLMVRMIILGVAWVWEVSFGTRVELWKFRFCVGVLDGDPLAAELTVIHIFL